MHQYDRAGVIGDLSVADGQDIVLRLCREILKEDSHTSQGLYVDDPQATGIVRVSFRVVRRRDFNCTVGWDAVVGVAALNCKRLSNIISVNRSDVLTGC